MKRIQRVSIPINSKAERKTYLCSLLMSILVFVFNQTFSQSLNAVASPRELKKLSVEELMNIEVTSVSKRPEKLNDVASAIQVITQEDIRRSGATSLPEALRLATNLQVAQINSSQWAISARGFNDALANKLLVMIDGRTVYTPLYAGVFWDVQNLILEDVERIEVISGPGGTLWGANAVNGVINIITKSGQNSQGLLLEAGTGTELRGYGGLRYGGKISKDIYYRIYGTAFQRGNTMNVDGSDANDKWTMAQGGFQLDWNATENNVVTLQSNLYDNRPNPDGLTPLKATGHNITGRWSHSNPNDSDYTLQVYYDHTWRDFRDGFTEKLSTWDLDWQHRFKLGNHQELVWGVGYRLMDHEVENTESLRFIPPHKYLHLYNLFVQDEITLIKGRLHLTLASKFEHNSYTGLQHQPSGRLSLTMLQNHTLWTAVSRAVRTPARVDRDFYIYTPGVSSPLLIGNDDFKSEKVLAYQLGWRIQSKAKFMFSIATFYHVYDNIRSVEPGPPPSNMPITVGNGIEGDTHGLELSGTYQPIDWWRLRGGYTFLKKKLSVKPTSKDINNGRAESNDPENQFLVQSMMDLPGKIELGFVVRFVDELPNPRVASYWGFDARLAWRPIEIIELSVVGQNLLDSNHSEFPSSPSSRELERSVYGKIVCRL